MRLPTFEQWEVVRIEWLDACGGGDEWENIEDNPGVSIHHITTVGQVHSQSAIDVTIVLSWDHASHNAGGWITIPESGITGYERSR